jgi:protein-S-isoprenylcysteine O-methyltransferase Ste14
MARSLNKTRMRDTRILMGLTIAAGVFCKTMFPDDTIPHEVLDLTGYILVTICAIGRIYCTAFIGGEKNAQLVTWGPYSMCRNPLYFFSLCGAAGVGTMTTSIAAFAIIFTGFFIIYQGLIAREEEFLEAKFGQPYRDYCQRVPRLFPSFRNVYFPEEVTMHPKFLNKGVLDAVWWFAAFPLIEAAEMLQASGIIKPIMQLF